MALPLLPPPSSPTLPQALSGDGFCWSSLLSMAGLSDLCFDPGVNFGRLVAQRFSCPVSPPSLTSASRLFFWLIVLGGQPYASTRILLGSSYKPSLVARHVISMSSTSLAGCFASLLVARMWASWFTTSRVLFAKSLLSISFFGVEVALIGAEIMLFGA